MCSRLKRLSSANTAGSPAAKNCANSFRSLSRPKRNRSHHPHKSEKRRETENRQNPCGYKNWRVREPVDHYTSEKHGEHAHDVIPNTGEAADTRENALWE